MIWWWDLPHSGRAGTYYAQLKSAEHAGAFVAALTGGDGGAIRAIADVLVIVSSAHILIGHFWCKWIDEFLAARESTEREKVQPGKVESR